MKSKNMDSIAEILRLKKYAPRISEGIISNNIERKALLLVINF